MADRPNLVLLITDQQRAPMHWPADPGWLDRLAPNDAELRRTGISFERAFTATCMCSPSRATFLTGTYPSRHGVTLTLTLGDLWPDPRCAAASLGEAIAMLARGDAPRRRLAGRIARAVTRAGPHGGDEPQLPAGIPTLGSRLRDAGYEVAYKGKWHLTKPYAGGHDWQAADAERLAREFGFAGWEPPDAGENAKAEHFGAGNAGLTGEGWDEDYTRQTERWLADPPAEPFCLVVSLVNPHDVLGYPLQYEVGGFRREQFAGLGVPLPPTIDEDLREKPAVHTLMKLGQTAYLGPLRTRAQQQDYVDFYAWLHGVVDEKIGRILRAMGDPADPASLRSRTVIARISDHGEMGLSHGGLQQKMFNAYEETIRVPFVISNPRLFPEPRTSGALVSLVDVVPTLLGLAGAPAGGTLDGIDLGPLLRGEAERLREHVLFTFDDHQAGTAQQEAPGQPNRIRCLRTERFKYAVYLDPRGRAAPEYELYDLEADPLETRNLLEVRGGRPRTAAAAEAHRRLGEALRDACERTGTTDIPLP